MFMQNLVSMKKYNITSKEEIIQCNSENLGISMKNKKCGTEESGREVVIRGTSIISVAFLIKNKIEYLVDGRIAQQISLKERN